MWFLCPGVLLSCTVGVGWAASAFFTRDPVECAAPSPSWIWCDDFEVDRLDRYFEHQRRAGAFERVPGVGRNRSFGMRARYRPGQEEAGALHLAFGRTPQPYFRPVDDGTIVYREIWWRFWLRLGDDWRARGGGKLTRAMAFASESHWGQAMIAHVWSGGPGDAYLVLDPATGISPSGELLSVRYNDFPHLHWLGAVRSLDPVLRWAWTGEWVCIEAHVRLNEAGRSNGEFGLWVNGRLQASRRELNWVGEFDEYGINAVFLENFWDGGAPDDRERYFDDFVVSQEPIGCSQ